MGLLPGCMFIRTSVQHIFPVVVRGGGMGMVVSTNWRRDVRRYKKCLLSRIVPTRTECSLVMHSQCGIERKCQNQNSRAHDVRNVTYISHFRQPTQAPGSSTITRTEAKHTHTHPFDLCTSGIQRRSPSARSLRGPQRCRGTLLPRHLRRNESACIR